MIYYVIIGKDKVYGAYSKTICCMESFTNPDEKAEGIKTAKAVVFDYAEGQGNVSLRIATDEKILGSGDVFNFLETNVKR